MASNEFREKLAEGGRNLGIASFALAAVTLAIWGAETALNGSNYLTIEQIESLVDGSSSTEEASNGHFVRATIMELGALASASQAINLLKDGNNKTN